MARRLVRRGLPYDDPRLIVRIAPAVAKAAMEGGVATRPLADLEAYEEQLQQFVYLRAPS